MSFATWGMALIAAGIAVPTLLILYFLRLRRRDLDVSSTLLWRRAVQDLQANAPFQKLRKNLLLFLQLLALAAALLAIAQPQIMSDREARQRQIIVIDRSASMNTLDGTDEDGDRVTRLEEAKRRAVEKIRDLREPGMLGQGEAEEAMVIAFDASAEIIENFTTDKDRLIRAIQRIEPTDAPTSLREAMQLVQAQRPLRTFTDNQGGRTEGEIRQVEGLFGGLPSEITVYSDGVIADAAAQPAIPDDTVLYQRVGGEVAPNAGIAGLRAERDYDRAERLSVFVSLLNTDTSPREVTVDLLIDGVPGAIKSATLPAGETPAGAAFEPGTGGVVFTLEREAGAVIEAVVQSQGDLLPTDDRARVVVFPAQSTAVAVVTQDNAFLADALAGLPLSRLDLLTPAEFREAYRAGETTQYDVVLLDGLLPGVGGDGAAGVLPPGRWLVFNDLPAPPQGGTEIGRVEADRIIDFQTGHPALRGLSLRNVEVLSFPVVELPEQSRARAIADGVSGPAIIEIADAETRAMVVPFDIAASSWPFDVSFVVFLAASIDYLAGDLARTDDVSGERSFRPGSVLTDRLPSDAEDIRIVLPDGERVNLTASADGRIAFGPLRTTGVYRVSWEGASLPQDSTDNGRVFREYAVNLVSPEESSVNSAEQIELRTEVVQGESGGTMRALRRFWPWLLAAMLAVVMFEWWVYNRKVFL